MSTHSFGKIIVDLESRDNTLYVENVCLKSVKIGAPYTTYSYSACPVPFDYFFLFFGFTIENCQFFSLGQLQIAESQETDQGKYECVAENEVGTQYSYSAQLYVRGKKITPGPNSVHETEPFFKCQPCQNHQPSTTFFDA